MTTIKVQLRRSALAFLAGGLAALIEPPVPLVPSAWAAEHGVLPDGDYRGEKVDLSRTPHIIEPLDLLGPDSPVNEIAVMKSGQTAFTTMLLCSIGHRIDRAPCDMVVVLPTDSALKSFNSTKLMRFIEASEVLGGRNGRGGKVYPQTSRANTGSTTYEKKYPRGALNLLLASSPADLRLLTYKVAYCDEVEEYSDDLDGQGDVIGLIARGQKSFIASGNWKRAYVSTPAAKQSSVIEPLYERGDQRRWHVKCPGCSGRFVFEWNAPFDRSSFGLKFNKEFPYQAEYVTQCCGVTIEGWQKVPVYKTGVWIATKPGAGRYPSYHFDELSAPFSTWEAIAKEFVEAGDDQSKLKRFHNITLGKTYEMKGDAPDHSLLMQRREPYRMGHIPPGALLLTIAADVQKRGIYVEVLAHAPDQQTWVIFADYLDGTTVAVDDGAFLALSELYRREWPDAFGNRWRADEFVIDAGYQSHTVYEWTRRHPGTKAVDGRDGWTRVPLGVAVDVDVNYGGRKIKGGAKLRPVGTWPLKSKFYEYLARQPVVDGSAIIHPPGYCHFGEFLDESYFRQITAEYLEAEIYRGRTRQRWLPRAGVPNHWFDCRIYNMAVADAYFAALTADDWANRAKERGIPADLRTPDLFAVKPFQTVSVKPVEGATQGTMPEPVNPFAGLAELNRDV